MERTSKLVQQLDPQACAGDSALQAVSDQKSGLLYTIDGIADEVMTMQQRLQYERDGFVMLKKLFSPDELAPFHDRFEKICNKEAPWGTMIVMRDVNLKLKEKKGSRNITKIQDWQDDKVLKKYIHNKKLVNFV